MEFSKIRWDGKTVELDYAQETPGGAAMIVEERGEDPSPAFKAALQAFGSYVAWVIGAPDVWLDTIEVRGVTIKRPDDQPRGIVVTALRKCSRARNGTIVINTPYLSDVQDGYAGERTGFLPAHVPELIDAMEEQATAYHNGDRGEQIPLGLEESENTKQFNDNAAAAEVASTRRPKGKKKGKDFIPGVGEVMNADAMDVLTDEKLRQLLLMVERDVPIDAITTWTSSDRSAAEAWARARQKELAQALKPDERVPEEPECVKESATLPLTADTWSDPTPPRLSDDGVHAIHDAART